MKTDIKKIIQFLRLYAKSSTPDFSDGIMMQHILFQGNVISEKVVSKETVGKRDNGFFFIDENNFEEVVDSYCDFFDKNVNDIGQLFIHIRKADRLQFFDYIKGFLNEKDYNEVLRDIWVLTEFPHQMPINTLVGLFNRADKKYLMDEEDYKVWESLGDDLVVYRGVQKIGTKEGKHKGLSWSLKKEVAEWFAKRWENNGAILKAEISKSDCFAYNSARNEEEIILNPHKLRNVEQVGGDVRTDPSNDFGKFKVIS